MPTNSGVHPGHLPTLEETLWEWTIAQERSCRLWGWEDAPWWYGERASISILAGAIWRSGGIALEEYSVRKSNPDNASKKSKHYAGRNDLYFKIGKTDFILEAKQFWPNLRSKDLATGLNDALNKAKDDVHSMDADGAKRLAAVFIAGRIPEKNMDEDEELEEKLIDAINSFSGAARAWIFPDQEYTHRFLAGKPTRRWYPGAAIVIQEAK